MPPSHSHDVDLADAANEAHSFAGKVFASPPRPSAESARSAAALGVATIVSAIDGPARHRVLPADVLRRVAGEGGVAGWALTVWNPPGDNTMLRFGIELCRPGDVLVVSSASDGAAQWGDLAHEWANARGAAGVVVDGSVRDIAAARAIGLSLWARNVDPRPARKHDLGYVNAPVQIAGTTVRPGDLVVADDDAVLVLAPDEVDHHLAPAHRRADYERRIRADIHRGAPWPERTGDSLYGQIERLPYAWNDADAKQRREGADDQPDNADPGHPPPARCTSERSLGRTT